MKNRFIGILIFVLFLVACNDDTTNDRDKVMNDQVALHYLEQTTYLLVEAHVEDAEDSFEQKSSLEASLNRIKNMIAEIEEGFDNSPLTQDILIVAEYATLSSKAGLDGDYDEMRKILSNLENEIDKISNTYLDGELPPAMIYLKRSEGALNE